MLPKIKNPAKERVKLRARELESGGYSLYLDVHDRGRRHTEYLRLYLVPERTREDAARNAQTLAYAEEVRALRVVELRNNTYGFSRDQGGRVDFMKFAWAKIETRPRTVRQNLRSAALKIQEFAGTSFQISEIDKRWLELFVRFLDRSDLSPNTAHLYFERTREMLGWAVRDGLILKNPADGVQPPKKEDSKREFLTLEELRRLADTPCRQDVSRAFLFSCLTGLRHSDVVAVRWADVRDGDTGARLVFRQKKTGRLEHLDLSEQAVFLMGERGAASDKVFSLPHFTTIGKVLKKWVEDAGIDKHITFHCGRHTFATLQLTLGTDIYTVSNLLGHRSVRTTQIYAKVIDAKKRAAVDRIPEIFGKKKEE